MKTRDEERNLTRPSTAVADRRVPSNERSREAHRTGESDRNERTCECSDHVATEPHPLLALQRNHGNQAVQRLVKSGLRPQLRVGRVGDKYEREADRVAERLLHTPDPEAVKENPSGTDVDVSLKISSFRTGTGGSGHEVDDELESQLGEQNGNGKPLPEPVRTNFEQRFGRSFDYVRVHRGHRAAELNEALNARAFTYGPDIYFGAGQYSPSTSTGKKLLAHELTHVVQQTRSRHTRQMTAGTEATSLCTENDAVPYQGNGIERTVGAMDRLNNQERSFASTSDLVIQRQELVPAGPPRVVTWRPPSELDQGMMPADGQIVTVNTRPLYNAINRASWPRQTRNDPGWAGWSQISALTSQHFWTQNMPNATTGGGIRQDLATQTGAVQDVISSIEIQARITGWTFEEADEVPISQSGVGGGTVGSSGTASQSVGGGAELNVETGGEGSPTFGGGVSGQMGSASSRTGQTGWQGTGTTGTAAIPGARFRFNVEWNVIIRQHIDAGDWLSVFTLGGLAIGAEIVEVERQQVTATSSGVVRFPQVRCRPGTTVTPLRHSQ